MSTVVRRLWEAPYHRSFLHLLLWVNVVGAIFGYNWYVDQIRTLPVYVWPVVVDSPLAVTGVALVCLLRLRGRVVPWLELWSALAVIKYGAWAAMLWIGSWSTGTPVTAFDLFGLFLTHIGMVVQGFIVLRRIPRVPIPHVVAVVGWFFVNDYVDYVHLLHPTFPSRLFVWCAASAIVLSVCLGYLGYRHLHADGIVSRGKS